MSETSPDRAQRTRSAAADPEFTALRRFSAEIGRDPHLIQGAGGNTSLKTGGAMWIKASGTQLENAERDDLFVCVDGDGIARAVRDDPARADEPQTFLVTGTLRPSIETCLHAVLPHRVVIHCHCINTIAQAIRVDAAHRMTPALAPFAWAFVPYRKPGAQLARGVLEATDGPRDVYVLGSHGLLIGAETVDAAATLLRAVVAALTLPPVADPIRTEGTAGVETTQGRYDLAPPDHSLHLCAFSPAKREQLATSALFPDQVLFCGPDIPRIRHAPEMDAVLTTAREQFGKPPPAFLLDDAGAYLRAGASAVERAMARCVGDVMQRVPEGAELRFFTHQDCAELLDWDAEKYRHQLNT
ncbi:MAG: class II aldolase/adducin family protein [Pseudomonadota bacterium]